MARKIGGSSGDGTESLGWMPDAPGCRRGRPLASVGS